MDLTNKGKKLCHAVKDATPADAAPVKRGWWLWTERGTEDWEKYYLCSVCGEHMYWQANYCPNCGAKMTRCDGLKLSNGDRIRAMSDDDLAELLDNVTNCQNCPCETWCLEYEGTDGCKGRFREWLQRSEEGEG